MLRGNLRYNLLITLVNKDLNTQFITDYLNEFVNVESNKTYNNLSQTNEPVYLLQIYYNLKSNINVTEFNFNLNKFLKNRKREIDKFKILKINHNQIFDLDN